MDYPLKQTMKFETITSIQKYRKYCAKSTTPPPLKRIGLSSALANATVCPV